MAAQRISVVLWKQQLRQEHQDCMVELIFARLLTKGLNRVLE